MDRFVALAAALLAVVVLADAAHAIFAAQASSTGNVLSASSDFCPGPQTFLASVSADSWVDQVNPTANRGTAITLRVRSRLGRNRRTLVQFTLPSLPIGCVVVQSRLRLYATASTPGRTIQATPVTAAWGETSVTWNNQPPAGSPSASTTSALGWQTWDVTAAVAASYADPIGSPAYGFLVRDVAEDSASGTRRQDYVSREGAAARRPQLEITVD